MKSFDAVAFLFLFLFFSSRSSLGRFARTSVSAEERLLDFPNGSRQRKNVASFIFFPFFSVCKLTFLALVIG